SYPDVRLSHFATMTSGYKSVGDTATTGYTHGASKTPFFPDSDPLFAPGSKYAYWDAAMNQFAHILTIIAEEPLDAFFKRRIGDPIGMNTDAWHWGDFGPIGGVKVVGGAGNNGKGIYISAIEMARFGLLFLNEGNWNGSQLISKNWIKQSTQVQVPASMKLGTPLSDIDGIGVYGFNWWVNGIRTNGSRFWPDAPAGTYAASGYNNNKMFIIPAWDMVVVRLGLDENELKITDNTWNDFIGKVGNAIED
ncbi:MAG: beta-lactamase family protein, partial [Saprospiraceae bacterium]|nr:beta-lactamase family protein [Saprospiraceae bacterium]